jgi:hypothetical protein
MSSTVGFDHMVSCLSATSCDVGLFFSVSYAKNIKGVSQYAVDVHMNESFSCYC